MLSNIFRIIGKKDLDYRGGVSPKYSFELEDKYGNIISLSDRSIARKLTKKEIDKFEIEEVTNKYNV